MTKKIIPFEINLKSSQRAGFTFQPRPQILTNDANSAELNFIITDASSAELAGSTATVLLFMKDGSFFQNTDVARVNNTFIYTIKPNQAKHQGIAQAQLVIKIGSVENASPLMEFEIIGGLETKPIVEREIQDWSSLTAEAKAFVDQIEGFTLESFVENKMGQELANLEVNYATRLTGLESNDASLTAQLEQIKTFHASKAIGKLERGEPATIVFLGDSTTEQNGTTNGHPNHVGLLTTLLKEKYGELVTVINAGISGHTITLMLERLHKDVLSHDPDLVFVCSGINDQGGTYKISLGEFKKNYNILIQEIISQKDTDVILRTPNVVMSAATSSGIDIYNDITRSLAMKYNLGLFDLFSLMRQDIADGKISVSTVGPFLNDSVHPNEHGQAYIFENFKSFFEPKQNIIKPADTRRMISGKGGFRHVGGNEFAGVNYVNGYALLFNQPSKRISFEYEGEDFIIIYGMTTGTGQFKVFVDGVQQGGIVDTYSPAVKYRASVSYTVPAGKHLVEIECQTTKNSASSSTNLQIQAVVYKRENRVNDGLIPVPYSYLDVRQNSSISLDDGIETTFIFNSARFNLGGEFASYVLATGEITFKKSGLYQICFSNRFVTTPDKSLEANYKINGTTIKRAQGRTPTSTVATPAISLDLTDIRVLNEGDKLFFTMNAQGTAPTNTAYAIIVKIGQ